MEQQQKVLHFCWHGFLFSSVSLILFLGQLQVTVVAKGSGYYTAAVLEHVRTGNFWDTARKEMIVENLDAYATAAKTAAAQEADIIVFPEWGLNRIDKDSISSMLEFAEDVPDPKQECSNPCENHSLFKDRPVLQRLSCIARDNALYLVANIVDIKNCTPETSTDISVPKSAQCPLRGYKLFNTNVVFNRKGDLVSRYYKYHLYRQTFTSALAVPEPAYFETDFGLFTVFICFDLAFREAVETIERKGVVNVVFSEFWYDHFPLMAAVQYQQAWALVNKVNLLASNVHYPGTGTIGSGIYSGTNGALVYTFNPDSDAKLLTSRVPTGAHSTKGFKTHAKIFRIRDGKVKDVTDEQQDSRITEQCSMKILGLPTDMTGNYRCNELNTTDYSFKKLEKPMGSLEICQKEACCRLSYNADSMDEDFYLGMHRGDIWIYNTYGFCTEVCMLMRCDKGSGGEICSTYPMISKTKFRSFKLSGSFSTKYVYPSVMKSKMRLAPTKEWEFHQSNGQSQISYFPASESGEQVLAAGMLGRCYENDPLSH